MSDEMNNPLLKACMDLEVEGVELPSEGGGNPDFPVFMTGAKGKIDENRSIEMILLSDNSFQIAFLSKDGKTSIRLSDEAIKITFALWMRLSDANKVTTNLPLNL